MFELAAFRKAHPTRPISLLPLFLFLLVAVVTMWMWFVALGFLILHHVASTATGVGPGTAAWVGIGGAFLFLPTVAVVHICRIKYREKHQLLMDLRGFQLERLSCEVDFDREFILNAVEQWYGSRNSFVSLVQGPLCEELLSMLPTPHLPLSFAALITSSMASLFLEQLAGLYLAGADSKAMVIFALSFSPPLVLSVLLGFNLLFYLGDRLAAAQSRVFDVTKTLASAGMLLAWILSSMGVATQVSSTGSVWYSLAWSLLHVVLLLWVFKPSGRAMASGQSAIPNAEVVAKPQQASEISEKKKKTKRGVGFGCFCPVLFSKT